ncbi:DEAD/DEAH box helicase [Roseibium sp.]|uniref:preprotein translocase subunit SecA n=1 Tax=Roseibium sp. TaxID=1936156 RepID=UPI003D0E2171
MSDSKTIAVPGLAPYPVRHWPAEGLIERLAIRLAGRTQALNPLRYRSGSLRRLVRRIRHREADLTNLSDPELHEMVRNLRRDIHMQERLSAGETVRCFALVSEVVHRKLGMRLYDVQLLAGLEMLRGRLVEVRTGEGKTLIAALPAVAVALSGFPVHVVTVNDYLARRDAEFLGPVFEFFGLSVGVVKGGMQPDERRRAYDCDVTYCTNKDLAFDHLRDRLVLGEEDNDIRLKSERFLKGSGAGRDTLLRGLHFAILDEVDSVLVDEARTPLILSREVRDSVDNADRQTALDFAGKLVSGDDFLLLKRERLAQLTRQGALRAEDELGELKGIWANAIAREELVTQALTALHFFQRNHHYLVTDDKIRIIDEYTGRIMEDRFWSAGLHQMIELKEGCEPTVPRGTVARMTYQRFFRRYCRMAGMSGTIDEVRRELWNVYRLPVRKIPTNRPPRVRTRAARVVLTDEEKWEKVAGRVAEFNATGAPVLIGTRSVEASRRASAALTSIGIAHVVLNAEQDAEEANIVAAAGECGAVTVATNMAGRGTDIKLGSGAVEAGGLHVIMTEYHDARRIDRQLAGRCGRQGDPGYFETWVSLDDTLMTLDGNRLLAALARRLLPVLGMWVGRLAFRHAQMQTENLHMRMRYDLLNADKAMGEKLAFAGRGE